MQITRTITRATAALGLAVGVLVATTGVAAAIEPMDDPIGPGAWFVHRIEPVDNPILWF